MLRKLLTKLLILLVLSLQFVATVHAVEHQFEHNEEHHYCSLCIHEFESKSLLVNKYDLLNIDSNQNQKISKSTYVNYLVNLSNYSARSPPSTLI